MARTADFVRRSLPPFAHALCLVALGIAVSPAQASPAATVQRLMAADGTTIVDVIPKSGPGLELSSPAGHDAPVLAPPPGGAAVTGFPWVLQAQNDGVYTDLSMADATHGFAAAELGRVYRTTDGATWQVVMNIGFPRYWYGVHTFTPDSVFVTGFQNQTGEGIGRWSTNGGATWTNDIVIDPAHWLTINQFADSQHGVATAIGSGLAYVTTNGGATAGDWSQVLADPTQGWFAGNCTFLPENLYVYLTGISFCQSTNGGLSYSRRPSIDLVFDGGVSFSDVTHGWTGGGQISTPVQGWVHRTTDGGVNWSGRILNPPYPIRSLLFLDEALGFAVGGNYFQGIGGIWSTTDGGANWDLDADTGCEMKGIDWARVSPDSVSVWCAGSRSGVGRIYRTTVYFPGGTSGVADPAPAPAAVSVRVAPNPVAAGESVSLTAPMVLAGEQIVIVDVAGRVVRRLTLGAGGADNVAHARWDGRDERGRVVAAAVYHVRLAPAEGRIESRIVVLP